MHDEKDLQQRMRRIEGLVETVEATADPNLRASAIELMGAVMELHGAAVERMMEVVFEKGAIGAEIIDDLGADRLVASMLLLHGLHPLDLETRVDQALERVRPYLKSHGGDVELVGVDGGIVRLKLAGSCNGCASSAMTMKLAIEDAIVDAAPDATHLEVEGVVAEPAPKGLVQLGRAPRAESPATDTGAWEAVVGLDSLADGTVRALDVSGRAVLFCRHDGALYAYGDACPACGRGLAAAALEAASLACRACGERYDVRHAGRGIDTPDLHLAPFPLLVEEGRARVALPGA